MFRQAGFTLVELMITVAVIGALLLASANLTGTWIDRSKVNSAQASFEAAITQAKALALRNAGNQLSDTPAVSVCIDNDNDRINIIQLGMNAANLCDIAGNTLLQKYSIAPGIYFKQLNNNVECLVINSLGMLIYPAGSACISDFSTKLIVGRNNESTDFKLL